jgi:hypothetical protein
MYFSTSTFRNRRNFPILMCGRMRRALDRVSPAIVPGETRRISATSSFVRIGRSVCVITGGSVATTFFDRVVISSPRMFFYVGKNIPLAIPHNCVDGQVYKSPINVRTVKVFVIICDAFVFHPFRWFLLVNIIEANKIAASIFAALVGSTDEAALGAPFA